MTRFVRVMNTTRGTMLGGRIRIADDFRSRMLGLLGSTPPSPGEGLLLSPCRGIHMLGMRYPLDILFLDSGGAVLSAHNALRPGPRFRWSRHAASTLELPAGTLQASGTQRGDLVVWSPADGMGSPSAPVPVSQTGATSRWSLTPDERPQADSTREVTG